MPKPNFFRELKRRNVYRVAITYAVVAWVLIQVASILLPTFEAPMWVMKTLTLILVIGFPVALVLAWAFEMSPEGIIRTNTLAAEDNPLPSHKKKPLTSNLIIGILILVIAGQFIYSRYFDGQKNEESREKSIAVLPFENMSGDDGQQYLSDGLTEELIYRLSMVKDFSKVISRASVMRYKDTNMSIPAIANELGVANILTGSFVKSGEQIRITASLIHGKTEKIIAPYRYDRPFGDIFDIQSEVANDIVDKLSIDLNTREITALSTSPTYNLEAYNLYLKARQRGYEIARIDSVYYSLLTQAVAVDSSLASAYAGMANYWNVRGLFLGDLERDSVISNVEFFLDKALELDENDVHALDVMASYQLFFHWDFRKAEYYFRKMISLNPHFSGFLNIMVCHFFSAIGKTSEAVHYAKVLLQNDVFSSQVYSILFTFYLDGQVDESLRLLNNGLELFGVENNQVLFQGTRVLNYLGEYERVIELIATAFDGQIDSLIPGYAARLAIAYIGTGQLDKAESQLDRLLALSETRSVGSPSYYASMILANQGRIEDAFVQLQMAYKKREVEMYWLKVEPLFEPLRGDPRWQEMLDKVGFPE